MLIYLLLFTITAILFYIAQAFYKKSPVAFYVISYAAIFLLAFMAGCRDNTIGTDIHVYGEQTFVLAKYCETVFSGMAQIYNVSEPFFFLINYIALIFTEKIGFALFLITLIQTVFAFHGFKRYMDRVPLWLMMLAYCFVFYNLTLSMMRQGLALTFLFFSCKYFDEQKTFKLILCFALSFFFHRTALLFSIILLWMYWISLKDEKSQKNWIIIVSVSAVIGIVSLGVVINTLSQSYEIIRRYAAYAGGPGGYNANLSTIDIGSRLIIFVLVLFFRKRGGLSISEDNFLLLITIIDISSMLLGIHSKYATRFGFYAQIFEIPLLLAAIRGSKVEKYTQYLFCFIVISSYAFIFYWILDHFGWYETIPYTSKFLGI